MKITLITTKKGVQIKSDTNATFDEMMEILLTATEGLMHNFADKVPKRHRQILKERIYDNFNDAASNILDGFIPEKELRPDLTAEAIKRMEDEIMKEHIDKYESKHGPVKDKPKLKVIK